MRLPLPLGILAAVAIFASLALYLVFSLEARALPADGSDVTLAADKEMAARAAGSTTSGQRIGQRIGRYVILEKIGNGGMGEVYRAGQLGGPDVAIKILREPLAEGASSRRHSPLRHVVR